MALSPFAFPAPVFLLETLDLDTSLCRFLIVDISTRYSSLNSEFSLTSFSFFLRNVLICWLSRSTRALSICAPATRSGSL